MFTFSIAKTFFAGNQNSALLRGYRYILSSLFSCLFLFLFFPCFGLGFVFVGFFGGGVDRGFFVGVFFFFFFSFSSLRYRNFSHFLVEDRGVSLICPRLALSQTGCVSILVCPSSASAPWLEFLHPGAGIMEADDRQVTTVFTVQPSFHHRHSTNPVS